MNYYRVWFSGGYFATVLATSADEAIQEALLAREKMGYFKAPKTSEAMFAYTKQLSR